MSQGWRSSALCAGHSGLFFRLSSGGAPSKLRDRVDPAAEAKAVCRRCPVRRECLDYAMENEIVDGVWGGTDERERKLLRKARAVEAS